MRTAFFLLLLANAAFFGYSWFSDVLFPGESQLLQQQINPEAIKVVVPAQLAKAAPGKREKKIACLEWGAFPATDAARVEEALAPFELGSRLAQRRVDEAATWWVFMSPQGSRAAATVKTGELKRLGIEDYFIVQEDPKYRFAISLGVFRTQEAAMSRLEQLRAKGVRSAQVGAREAEVQKLWFQVRDVPEAVAVKLKELRQAFPGSEVRDCVSDEKKQADSGPA